MSNSRTKKGALYIGTETAFGDGAAADLTYWRVEESTFPVDRNHKDGNDVTIGEGEDRGVFLRNPAEISVTSGMHPICRTYPTEEYDPADGDPPIVKVLEAVLGGKHYGTMGTIDEGSTATVLKLKGGVYPSAFEDGEIIWLYKPATANQNVLAMGVVKSTNDLTSTVALRFPLPPKICDPGATPPVLLAEDTVILGGLTLYKKALPEAISLSAVRKGEKDYDVKQGLGMVPSSCQINAPLDDQATFSVAFSTAKILSPIEIEGNTVPELEDYPYPDGPQGFGGGLWLYYEDEGGVGMLPLMGDVSIDFGISATAIRGSHDTDPNGVSGYCITARRIRVTLSPMYDSANLFGLFDPEENAVLWMAVQGWWGPRAQAQGFCVPNARLVSTLDEGDMDGVKTLDFVVMADEYTGDGDGETEYDEDECGNKPFALGILAGK